MADEREVLLSYVTKGKHSARTIQYAHILLCSDEQVERQSEKMISQKYHMSTKMVERVRKSFCEEGMDIFTKKLRKTRSDKKLDARVESHLIALCCQAAPNNLPRWTLKMLADRLIELEVVDSITPMSVCNLLKKTNLSPSKKRSG